MWTPQDPTVAAVLAWELSRQIDAARVLLWLQVYTIDHEEGGQTRLDVAFAWADLDSPVAVTPDEEIVCDVSAGYVCARDVCSVLWHDGVTWWPIGETHMLALQDGMLLEYDTATFAPTGVARPPAARGPPPQPRR